MHAFTNTTRFIAYERVSTARQDQSGLGLAAQRKTIDDFAASRVAEVLAPFPSLRDAREQIRAWQDDYNHHRPHSGLGNIPPAEFAEKIRLEMRAA